MSEPRFVPTSLVRRYRATLSTLVAVMTIAIWPGLLFPIARAYVEYSFHHPFASPLSVRYPPYVVAALLLWMAPVILIALTLVIRQALGQYRLDHRTTACRAQPSEEVLAIARQVGITERLIVVVDPAPFAFCAGFFRPAVYISSGLLSILDPAEIEAVLGHEASHVQRHDPLRLFLLQLLNTILSPLPIIETLCARARIGIELAADRAALAIVPMPALAGAVLKVARAGSAGAQLTVAGLTASEARIDALLGRPINVVFGRRDLVITGFVLLTIAGMLLHLWSIKLCPICPTL